MNKDERLLLENKIDDMALKVSTLFDLHNEKIVPALEKLATVRTDLEWLKRGFWSCLGGIAGLATWAIKTAIMDK